MALTRLRGNRSSSVKSGHFCPPSDYFFQQLLWPYQGKATLTSLAYNLGLLTRYALNHVTYPNDIFPRPVRWLLHTYWFVHDWPLAYCFVHPNIFVNAKFTCGRIDEEVLTSESWPDDDVWFVDQNKSVEKATNQKIRTTYSHCILLMEAICRVDG